MSKLSSIEEQLLPKAVKYIQDELDGGRCPNVDDLRRELQCGQNAALILYRHIREEKLVAFPEKEELTPRQKELLPQVVAFIAESLRTGGGLPGRDKITRELQCGRDTAAYLRGYVIDNKLVDIPPEMDLREINEVKDDTWTITLPRTRIHTLEQLLTAFEVDLDVWEVERFICNKWEVGMNLKATTEHYTSRKGHQIPGWSRTDSKPIVESLYQVKVWLRRKRHATTEGYVLENARLRSRAEKLSRELRSEREMVRRLAAGHAGHDDLLANFKEFAQLFGDFSLPARVTQPRTPLVTPPIRAGHSEDGVVLLSDHHHGDVIRREDTSGFPEFNLTIGGNRLGYVMEKGKQIFTLHRAMYSLKKLYVWVGGDIGNGVLYDAPNANALFPPAQVHFSYHMLKFAIEDLLTLTVPDERGNTVVEQLVLLFSVGNHMRIEEKMPHKYQAQRNLDWLIYQFVIERFRANPKVIIREVMSPYIFEQIRGHRYLFAHGMQVGYKNSPDVQCRSMDQFIDKARALFDSPEWRRKNNFEGATFEHIVIGDIHVPVEFPRLTSNGSLNGQNELGVNWVLEPIPAGQKIFGVSESHEQTWQYFLNCSSVQDEPADMNAYGEFAAEYMRRFGRGGGEVSDAKI